LEEPVNDSIGGGDGENEPTRASAPLGDFGEYALPWRIVNEGEVLPGKQGGAGSFYEEDGGTVKGEQHATGYCVLVPGAECFFSR
jgi:hypothetical protein